MLDGKRPHAAGRRRAHLRRYRRESDNDPHARAIFELDLAVRTRTVTHDDMSRVDHGEK